MSDSGKQDTGSKVATAGCMALGCVDNLFWAIIGFAMLISGPYLIWQGAATGSVRKIIGGLFFIAITIGPIIIIAIVNRKIKK